MARSVRVSDFKSLVRLYTKRKQNRNKAKSLLRKIHGIDTETWNGNMFLLADSDGRYLDDITPENVFKFLFHKKYQNSWNFFYNLGYDAEVILKLLGKNLEKQYLKKRRLRFEFDKFKIWYIPDKCLAIRKGHHSVIFYDIAQFYGRTKLTDAYEKNIGKRLDPTYLEMKQKRKQFSPRFYRDNKNKIRKYCIQDCILTKELSIKWASLFRKAFGFYPARWLSGGYLGEKVLINNNVSIPFFNFVPQGIQELAYRSYYGGRFEILKRGFIGDAYLYDINSAYPHAFSLIPDLTRGKWVRSGKIHPKAKIGFFKIIANIPDVTHIPPFPFRKKNMIIFPSGKFETYVTLQELLACENSKYYKILDSYQFIPSKKTRYPYKKFIEKLYNKRLALKRKGDPLELPFKMILNSIYGKTGETVNKIVIGNIFNPVIFATITGYVRAQLYTFVKKHKIEKNVVSFATDSIAIKDKIRLPKSNKLGEMKLEKEGNDVYYLQNGYYRFNDTWKSRGFGKLNGKKIEHLRTTEKDGRLYLEYVESRNTRLRSAIIQHRIEDIGKIKPKIKKINLNADRKRSWLGTLESIDSRIMNESIPISLNYFEKDKI
ncbi:MAG: DNA polymerase [Nitrososphaera sp.]|jgi:hypothetical protein